MTLENVFLGRSVIGEAGNVDVISPWNQTRVNVVSTASVRQARQLCTDMGNSRSMVADLPIWRRRQLLEGVADHLQSMSDEIIDALVREAGKTRKESKIEISRACEVFRMVSAALVSLEGKVVPMSSSPAGEGRLGFELWTPAGLVVAIAPFNAPLNLVASKVAAALGAGCPVIAKPPMECPSPGNFVAQAVLEAGWPEQAMSVIHGGADIGAALVAAPEPRIVAFTGSSAAGEAITRSAGLKNLVLELGSIAPTIVCSDADLDDAATRLIRGAFGSSGQACISTQRLFVEAAVAEEFTDKFLRLVGKLKVGDAADPDTDIGPLITKDAADRVAAIIQDTRDRGGRFLAGGGVSGQHIEPTVVTDVGLDWPICAQELFGPAVAIIPFDDDAKVIDMANGTEFGLQAGVFTGDLNRAMRFAEGLDFGSVQINESSRVRLDLHAFGGVKASGLGREGIHHMLRAMMEIKFVGLRQTSSA